MRPLARRAGRIALRPELLFPLVPDFAQYLRTSSCVDVAFLTYDQEITVI